MEIGFILGVPLLGGITLAMLGQKAWASALNSLFSFLLLAATAFLVLRFVKHGPFSAFGEQFFIDSLNIFLIALTSLVAFTTSLFSGTYMRREKEEGRLTPGSLHLYHSMFQIFVLTMVLALSSNNLGILWVSMEAATLSTVLLVSLYRTKAGFGAAWNYFILCSVGISQALFGTILLYFSAAQVAGPDEHAILWTHLESIKDSLPPSVVSLAFIFLLVGYGAKAGLVPLHNWLPDAHAEGPTPVSALLSGLLLNVALYAILRVKILVDGALHSNFAGNLMMAFGLLSVVVAAFFLLRQKSLKRLFAYSSIEHVGLMTFAFGLGGVGSMAGLLHMTTHTLAKSAAFFAAGEVIQKAHTQTMGDIRGVIRQIPGAGWGLMFAGLLLAGIPPSGIFLSEFMMLGLSVRQAVWTLPFMLVGLGVGFAAIVWKIQEMVFGEAKATSVSFSAPLVWIHLVLAILLGFYIPPHLLHWYREAAKLLG